MSYAPRTYSYVVVAVSFFVSIAVAFTSVGCASPLLPATLKPPRLITVAVPSLPRAYEDWYAQWTLTWWDGASVRERDLPPATATEARKVELEIAETGADLVVFAAKPTVTAVDVALSPFGGWVASPDTTGTATYRRGILADTLLDLAEDGLNPAHINVERIQARVDEEYDTEGYDTGEYGADGPAIDRRRLEEGLRSGAFRSYHVRRREEPIVEVRFLIDGTEAYGRWIWRTDRPGAPLCAPVIAGQYAVWGVPVAAGATRTLFRRRSTGGYIKMVLHRTAQDHETYHLFPVTSRQN